MKINENSRVTVPWPAVAKGASVVETASRGRDGVSLSGLAEARELLRRLPVPGEEAPDLARVAAAAARLKDGTFVASAEDVADAILDELSTVMLWLSDGSISRE
ncbi:MAG: hypothetical protein GYA21_02615 [Myxococcales bacterium]|nr:hypothetical protein [Myxococcales bacterium]